MQNVTNRIRNPFGMEPPCERYVPGYGDANAHFHVIGDHPGIHGGIDSGVPFTETAPSEALQAALVEAGLFKSAGDEPTVDRTFLSYLYMCFSETEPTAAAYADMERFFDAELRAIAAHVLLPVGVRATEHVLSNYTARSADSLDMAQLHGQEIRGSGFLVVPIADPAKWANDEADRLVDALRTLQATDYRRESDLGRFIAGSEPYFVR
ncbi:uracil-DNA glycosylase family protein [Halalkalirubrum salinum]|uniref:uracil-DNA glycosylase family protein n=1 Tax=Halalkalirubrum salinum TaxID=2563889 RepID=UPI0010FAE747|nr:uracil-DNA glycosylase family protein [Halalkalirubrum salinum]